MRYSYYSRKKNIIWGTYILPCYFSNCLGINAV